MMSHAFRFYNDRIIIESLHLPGLSGRKDFCVLVPGLCQEQSASPFSGCGWVKLCDISGFTNISWDVPSEGKAPGSGAKKTEIILGGDWDAENFWSIPKACVKRYVR